MERLDTVSLIWWHCDSARESPTNKVTTTKKIDDVVGNLSRERRSKGKLKNCAVSLNNHYVIVKKLYLHEVLQHESKQRHNNWYLHLFN